MPQFAMSKDRLPREDDEIVDIGEAASIGTARCSAMEGLVRRFLEKQIQRIRRPVRFMRQALPVHLLQAEDVGAKPFELGPEDIGSLLDCYAGARDQVEVLKIERGNTHDDPVSSAS